MTVFIDTYAAVQKLTKDKTFSKKQAEVIVSVVSNAGEGFSTKSDIRLLRRDMEALRMDIEILRKDMEKNMEFLRKDLLINMYGLIFVATGIILAAIKYF